ncbi:hypothetical protein [Liquorilactobacillus satsumensis]|uniref:Uncharacterized protein n=2 Tax=Liquorilactobacillus satsumensis TaxID=259059 RepID=A0A0R1VAB8_9LACO|nr:hypothetical protein FD50_GL002478 [Liquorilactobacillus satsumensis DSM 16230 = JCM 12392]
MFFWIMLVVLLLVIFWLLREFLHVRRLKKMQLSNKEVTSKALKFAFAQFNLHHANEKLTIAQKTAKLADVWGSGVMAYEFQVHIGQAVALKGLKKELTESLQSYAENRKLFYQGSQAFVISDLWQAAGILHLDITYVVNEKTKNYLQDLQKVE